ncbi:MAG: hypothetical protein HRU40_16950, partial [Saprospiraceae bacterium]|nr:hypothetical protein [Saprospiraceae bacterium]
MTFYLTEYHSGVPVETRKVTGKEWRRLEKPVITSFSSLSSDDERITIAWNDVENADYYRFRFTFQTECCTKKVSSFSNNVTKSPFDFQIYNATSDFLIPGKVTVRIEAVTNNDVIGYSGNSVPKDMMWRTTATGGTPPKILSVFPTKETALKVDEPVILRAEVSDDGAIDKVVFNIWGPGTHGAYIEDTVAPYEADFSDRFNGTTFGTYTIYVTVFDNYGKSTTTQHDISRPTNIIPPPTVESVVALADGNFNVTWSGSDYAIRNLLILATNYPQYGGIIRDYDITGPVTEISRNPGSWYYITSCYGNNCDYQTRSELFKLEPFVSTPDKPTLSLLSQPDADGKFTLTWSKTTTDGDYNVYESVGDVNGTPINIYSNLKVNQIDITRPTFNSYFYSVEACNEGGCELSNILNVDVQPTGENAAITINSPTENSVFNEDESLIVDIDVMPSAGRQISKVEISLDNINWQLTTAVNRNYQTEILSLTKGDKTLFVKVTDDVGHETLANIVFTVLETPEVLTDSSGDLYISLPKLNGIEYIQANGSDNGWSVTELTQEQWNSLVLLSSNYTVEYGEFQGDGLEDFKIINNDTSQSIIFEQTGEGYLMHSPEILSIDIKNLNIENSNYQVSWTSTTDNATFELFVEVDGVWGSGETIVNETIKNVSSLDGRYRYKIRACIDTICSASKISAPITLYKFTKASSVVSNTPSLAELNNNV